VIQDEEMGESSKETSNFALITIKDGSVSAKQVEGEFRAQAGLAQHGDGMPRR
jgi:hypothetical protein